MTKPGSSLRRMQAVRNKRWKNTTSSLRRTGKALSAGSKAGKKAWKKLDGSAGRAGAAPAKAAERKPSAPLSPEARRVRLAAIAAAVIGGLLSLAVAPVGSVICLAGVVVAVKARSVAALLGGGEGSSDGE